MGKSSLIVNILRVVGIIVFIFGVLFGYAVSGRWDMALLVTLTAALGAVIVTVADQFAGKI